MERKCTDVCLSCALFLLSARLREKVHVHSFFDWLQDIAGGQEGVEGLCALHASQIRSERGTDGSLSVVTPPPLFA